MVLIIRVGAARSEWWRDAMQTHLPELECRLWDAPGDRRQIEYAVVWRPPPGGLAQFPNLRCIFSIGAGVDHILSDPELPVGVPVVRLVGAELTQRMTEYVVLHVLRFHRRLPEIEAQQSSAVWSQPITPPAARRRVGIMGLGVLGKAAATTLLALGFTIAGWSRSPKKMPGVVCYHADEQFEAFLAGSEILVCLLPLTPQTEGILNRALFAALPIGAYIINPGRGEHLVEKDLLVALERGQIAGATLDVFRTEPLPERHPFWRHPDILVTPHVASLIDPEVGARLLAENIRRFQQGEITSCVVDCRRGY